MRKLAYLITTALYTAFITIGLGSCSHEKNELVHDHAHEHGHDHGHAEEHAHGHEKEHEHGGSDEIILAPALAEKMGVKTEKIEPRRLASAVAVSGKIYGATSSSGAIVSPTRGIFTFTGDIAVGKHVTKGQTVGKVNSANVAGGDANAAALAALNNAKRELERLTPLYEKKLITAEKYNAALADFEAAKAAYSPAAATGIVKSPISGVITDVIARQGEYVEAGSLVAQVSDAAKLTLTVDVPERYAGFLKELSGVRILTADGTTLTLDERDVKTRSLANNVSVTPGYIPVSFNFDNDSRIISGSIVEAYLLGESGKPGIVIPLSAVTEQQGNYFAYVKVDEEGYMKMPIKLGENDGKYVEVESGLKAGEELVVDGVTALRMAETSGAVPEGHTHSH